jgi:Bacterial inner membrane protein
MSPLIIQGIGFVALFFVILSFQKKERLTLLWVMLIGLLFFVVHFSLLGAWTGAFMNLIEAGIVFVSFKKGTATWARWRFWPHIFIIAYILAGFLTFKTSSDILPIIAQIFGAIAVWQKSPRAIRFIMLVPRPLWFVYNFIVGSYAGMVTEALILLSVVIGIVRFDILRQAEKKV